MYAERIEGFRSLLEETGYLNEKVTSFLSEFMNDLLKADRAIETMDEPSPAARTLFKSALEESLNEFIDVLDSRVTVDILQWVSSTASSVAECFQEIVTRLSLPPHDAEELEYGRESLQSLSQRALVLADAERIKATLAEANAVVEDIKEQAGVAGETGNLTFYRKFADDELKAARWFRIASIALISAAVGIATFYAVWEFNHPATQPDWTAVVYRTAIFVGIGALSAYLARQAGQHRRLYNWANALEVQLQSFQNFIAPMTDEERHEVRLHFARRVLGSPPDPKTGESSDDTVPTAQLLDIVSAAIRRGATS